jgi:hypothetical protein
MLIFIYLSKAINCGISLADDTIIKLTSSNFGEFKNHVMIHFQSLYIIKANRLSLNFDKTRCLQFTTTNSSQIDLEIIYTNKLIYKAYDTTFLAIYAADRTLACRIRTEEFTHKYITVCYVVRTVKVCKKEHFLCQGSLPCVKGFL